MLPLIASGLYFVLEQPSSSTMLHHPAVHAALRQTRARAVSVSLKNFGGDTAKPLTLRGTAPWLERSMLC